MSNDAGPIAEVENLTVSYFQDDRWAEVVHGVSFALRPAEVLGLVGESGCGKTTVALQLLGYRPEASRVEHGRIRVAGRDLLEATEAELQRIRGRHVSYVPQNPMTALNPSRKIGALVGELLLHHGLVSPGDQVRTRAVELLEQVGLPTPEQLLGRYPHQLSGGQMQRVAIAMAIACRPEVVVLDEPTTGLDVSTQKQILRLLSSLREQTKVAMVYVTHDLEVLREIGTHIAVMYAGRIVEIGDIGQVYGAPAHPYTRGLLASVPSLMEPDRIAAPLRGMLQRDQLPPGCGFYPRCDHSEEDCRITPQHLVTVSSAQRVACQRWRDIPRDPVPAIVGTRRSLDGEDFVQQDALVDIRGLSIAYQSSSWLRFRNRPSDPVVDGVSFAIARGETFGLVGESGSGKSTIARAISGLIAPIDGCIHLDGRPLGSTSGERTTEQRRRIQLVFQNPDSSLNPRRNVGRILSDALSSFFSLSTREVRARIEQALQDVRLPRSYAGRYPDELSGGERQRVAIARALIVGPDLLLCDEVLSALDVSVQAGILELLARLKAETGVSILFISHDLAVVRALADRIGVLYRGRLMETGPSERLFAPPYHPYTYQLLTSSPGLRTENRPDLVSGAHVASPRDKLPGKGCAYAERCALQLGSLCRDQEPPWVTTEGQLRLRCHLPLSELRARLRLGELSHDSEIQRNEQHRRVEASH